MWQLQHGQALRFPRSGSPRAFGGCSLSPIPRELKCKESWWSTAAEEVKRLSDCRKPRYNLMCEGESPDLASRLPFLKSQASHHQRAGGEPKGGPWPRPRMRPRPCAAAGMQSRPRVVAPPPERAGRSLSRTDHAQHSLVNSAERLVIDR